MALPLAVADTSVLICFHHLQLLNALSLFYRQILVPSPVRKEFLEYDTAQTREIALNELTLKGFFQPCDNFDSIEVELFRIQKMKGAEAEALSQVKRTNADVFLVDEGIGRMVAKKEYRVVHGSVYILAKLHKLQLVRYHDSIKRLKEELKFRISESIIEEVFHKVMKED